MRTVTPHVAFYQVTADQQASHGAMLSAPRSNGPYGVGKPAMHGRWENVLNNTGRENRGRMVTGRVKEQAKK